MLSDVEIWEALAAGHLTIVPTPEPTQIKGASIDLRLDKEITVLPTQPVKGILVDPSLVAVEQHVKAHGKTIDLDAQGLYRMDPHTFLLAWTLESVGLVNPRLAAQIQRQEFTGSSGPLGSFHCPKDRSDLSRSDQARDVQRRAVPTGAQDRDVDREPDDRSARQSCQVGISRTV